MKAVTNVKIFVKKHNKLNRKKYRKVANIDPIYDAHTLEKSKQEVKQFQEDVEHLKDEAKEIIRKFSERCKEIADR